MTAFVRSVHSSLVLAALLLLVPASLPAQWAEEPGAQVRNAFGPQTSGGSRQCRGACGAGCPSSCSEQVVYECDGELLRRVEIFECGTHLGCRQHDDCLDRCSQQQARGFDCDARCHSEAVERFGFETATSWAAGGGPYDGAPIVFEYTRDAPDALEPSFRCPDGALRECAATGAACRAADGSTVPPVFASYAGAGPDAMRISGLRTGRLCGAEVCDQSVDIVVNGSDSCDQEDGPATCTRYAMEFDYQGADPTAPLDCSTSTSGDDDDFIGGLIKKGFDAAPELGGDPDNGLGQLLGMLQKVVTSTDSPEDLDVSIAPLGADGRPIESQRVGSQPRSGPRPIPRTVELPAPSGHLVVPMYQVADSTRGGQVVEREIRCTHQGVPVLETTFRLHFSR